MRTQLPISSLRLPRCGIPKPGDGVIWFQLSKPFRGVLVGHRSDARPYIANEFGNVTIQPSFDFIRCEDAEKAVGPNWSSLTPPAQIVRPYRDELRTFEEILSQRTPPGPQYIELVSEIWSRGFEVFVVGGTVRDVLAKERAKDVDLVTTMPLMLAKPLLQSMYRYRQSKKQEMRALMHGHIRLGGRPGSWDPAIDLCVFKHDFPGTEDAIFGSDFASDVAYRDFACNSVYYDPINKALIDPTGVGISNAENRTLSIVSEPRRQSPYDSGRLAIRFFKFQTRGYAGTPECCDRITRDLRSSLSAMHASRRVQYIQTQVLKKYPKSEHADRIAAFHEQFISFGVGEVWDNLIEPYRDDILRV